MILTENKATMHKKEEVYAKRKRSFIKGNILKLSGGNDGKEDDSK